MPEALTNHLWQSTLFALAVGLLTLAFQNNRAQIRYWLWFSASLKFLIPFFVLLGLGAHLGWTRVATRTVVPIALFTIQQVTQPFQRTVLPETANVDWIRLGLPSLWLCGFSCIALMRIRGWLRIRAALRSSIPIDIAAPLSVRACGGLLEPGVVGLFRSVLLLPSDIQQRLTVPQLDAVISHESCHAERHDNLTSAIHMLVEAVFWFHPFVWWLGARMLEERERACDEAVLRLGTNAADYAEGILNVCRSYLESPLRCVAGVTGSNLKRRIQLILAERVPSGLTLAQRMLLSVAAIAAILAPVGAGMLNPRVGLAMPSNAGVPKFEAVSIKPCGAYSNRPVPGSPGRLQTGCTTLQRLMQKAYGVFGDGQENLLATLTITSGPAWTDTEFYEIDALTSPSIPREIMNGPMLQALLEDRFSLKIHHETREVPIYKMTVAEGGLKIKPFEGTCIPPQTWDFYHPPPPSKRCGASQLTSTGVDVVGESMADLCFFFLVTLDRPVVDETKLTDRFSYHLGFSPEDMEFFHGAHGVPARSNPAVSPPNAAFVSAVKLAVNKLGLNLEPANGPGEFIVIDSVARPSAN